MAQVNTVRGPVDGGLLGRTLMHEHIFVLSPEIEKTGRGMGRGGRAGPRRDQAARAQGARDRHAGRPDGGRAGPLHPAGGGHRRAGAGDQRRRGDRRVHLQRGPDVLPLPGTGDRPRRARADGRPLRPRDPRGDRRDRRAGRHPEVRLRPPGHHARASSACCGPWPRPTGPPACRSPRTRRRRPSRGDSSSSASSRRRAST